MSPTYKTEPPQSIILPTSQPSGTTTTIESITSTTLKYKVYIINQTVNVTQLFNVTKYLVENITINLTESQKSDIINIKPNVCNNIGCSEGFVKAKYMIMDILGMDTPKFSERPSIGFDPFNRVRFNDSIVSFLIQNDGFTDYFPLNSTFWRVNHPINSSIYDLNVTFVWNYTYLYNVTEGNKTALLNKTFYHKFNVSMVDIFDRDLIYVRRV